MAIQDFSRNTGPAARAADPRQTMRAPFPIRADAGGAEPRLTQRERDEVTSGGVDAPAQRTVARCPACGKPVRSDQDYVRHRGELYHTWCPLPDGDGDGNGDGPPR